MTSTTQSEDEDPFDEPEGAAAIIPTPQVNINPEPIEPARLVVNMEAWNHFLEQSYPHQLPEHHPEDNNETPLQLKDSGIARPSFNASVDILGKK